METHYYVYKYVRKPADGGKPYYCYERTCGTERRAQERVKQLGEGSVYLINHLIRGAFY